MARLNHSQKRGFGSVRTGGLSSVKPARAAGQLARLSAALRVGSAIAKKVPGILEDASDRDLAKHSDRGSEVSMVSRCVYDDDAGSSQLRSVISNPNR